jgi:hypothetical protein
MSNRQPCTYRTRDLTQAIAGAVRGGMKVQRIEIDRNGKITVLGTPFPHRCKPAASSEKRPRARRGRTMPNKPEETPT